MASKKRRSGQHKTPRQGISGNPQRRAEQLAQRQPAIADEPDLSSLRELAYALADEADPSPWWDESHRRILAAARTVAWPSRLLDLETQACRIVGDEFYERLNSESGGLAPSEWLRALAEKAAAELRASVAEGTSDWRPLQALLRGLALTAPPGDSPYETVRAEAGRAAKLLADRGLDAGLGPSAVGARAAGDPLVAYDAYGSRFLLVAPFGYHGGEVDHWYAWDVDTCWLINVVGAGVFGSAQDALAEWQDAAGPAAAGTALSPAASVLTTRLLADSVRTGLVPDSLEGSEPRELIREYYRFRQRASALVSPAAATAAVAAASSDDDPSPALDAFLAWYTARHGDVPPDTADAVDLILYEWGPPAQIDEPSRYTCSPHRIEMAARLIRDTNYPDPANEALRLFPEWTQWCIEQSGLPADFAARSRGAALTEATTLVDEEKPPTIQPDEGPFRRQE